MIEYYTLISKYIPSNEPIYRIYITHCTLVTYKSLEIARRLQLSTDQQYFIQEAAMLHDIGIMQTNAPKIYCHGQLPYICHIQTGHDILLKENLPEHAQVALLHTGVGITQQEISQQQLPLDPKDYIPQTIEQRIIAYADCFYSKLPDTIWIHKSLDDVRQELGQFGQQKVEIFNSWVAEFEPHLLT